MSRLAGFPQGLLSLLGSQDFGEAPNELSQVIVPIVDLTPMYQASKQSIETTSPGNAIAGVNGTTFQVPTGETWIIKAADVRMAAGAGAAVSAFCLVITSPGPSGNAALFASEMSAVAANQIRHANLRFPGIVLPSGAGIGYYAEGLTLATPVFVTVAATRLRA